MLPLPKLNYIFI